MMQENEESKADGDSDPETWSQADSDCSSDVRDFWDGIIDSRIDRIGRAPSQRYSSATTSSIEALDEEKQILEDAMEVIRYRCTNEKLALQGILEALREHLECEEHAIARSIATIHKHRNLLMPVMRLPPEILSQIFVFHASMEESWLDAALTSTHVCKRWWQIGRACPELWSHIKCEDCNSTAWMARMIRRSRAVPLSLTVGSRAEMEVPAQEMALVIDNIHRCESLELRVPRKGAHYRPFFEAFSQPVPMLHHLTVSNHGYSIFAFPPDLLGGSAPNLRHMKLSTSSYIPWDSALFAHLTTLDITGSEESGDGIPPSLDMVLSALARIPGLESLILRRCFHRPTPSMTVCTHADLSNLKRLEVVAPFTRCTSFLRQITINAGTVVVLDLRCSSVSREDVEEFFTVFPSSLYTTSLPTAQALKFTWGKCYDFNVDVWTVQQDTKVKRSQNASIKLRVFFSEPGDLDMSPLDLTWACFAALATSQLRSFRVSNGHIGWDAEIWRKFAQMVPDLRMLAPGQDAQCLELCKALSPPDGLDLVPADCCLPALSYLELEVPNDDLKPTPDKEESSFSARLARSLAARTLIGCSTPDLVFVEGWRRYPKEWWEPFRDAIPGIKMYVRRLGVEGYMG